MDVVFLHGAGEGAHEEDARMAASLSGRLGEGYRIDLPMLPVPDDPTYERWGRAIGEALARTSGPVILVGHSFGGYMLVRYLAQERPAVPVASIHLVAAPIPGGDEDWTWDGFELPEGFGGKLPEGAPVFLYASEDDEWVPFAHRDLWAAAIPRSVARTTTGGHQLGDDLSLVAEDIRSVARA